MADTSSHEELEELGEDATEYDRSQMILRRFPMISKLQLRRIEATWQQFDADNSGAIELKELEAALTSLGVSKRESKALLVSLDTDGDGELDFPEFVAAYAGIGARGEGFLGQEIWEKV